MAIDCRYNKVLDLRTFAEIQRFLDTVKTLLEIQEDERTSKLAALQDFWISTSDEYLPSIVLSESRLLYRKLFGTTLREKMHDLLETDVVNKLKKTELQMDVSFIKLAIDEGNYYMTKKYYR